jgi:hypothetical protein
VDDDEFDRVFLGYFEGDLGRGKGGGGGCSKGTVYIRMSSSSGVVNSVSASLASS